MSEETTEKVSEQVTEWYEVTYRATKNHTLHKGSKFVMTGERVTLVADDKKVAQAMAEGINLRDRGEQVKIFYCRKTVTEDRVEVT